MPFSALITLTSAGADTGPFNLYSNIDGYAVPFESGIPKASLEAGYASALVPDGTTSIQVKSVGVLCKNFVNLPLVTTTTTTTTTPPEVTQIEISNDTLSGASITNVVLLGESIYNVVGSFPILSTEFMTAETDSPVVVDIIVSVSVLGDPVFVTVQGSDGIVQCQGTAVTDDLTFLGVVGNSTLSIVITLATGDCV